MKSRVLEPRKPGEAPPPNWKQHCWEDGHAVLVGRFAHYCAELDGRTLDETLPEFAACACFGQEPTA